jgi:hypothetical protein
VAPKNDPAEPMSTNPTLDEMLVKVSTGGFKVAVMGDCDYVSTTTVRPKPVSAPVENIAEIGSNQQIGAKTTNRLLLSNKSALRNLRGFWRTRNIASRPFTRIALRRTVYQKP